MSENNYDYENPNVETQPEGTNLYDGKAKAAQVCGIISVIPCFWGLIGLVLGIIALVMSNQYVQATGDAENGAAKTGKICGLIGVIGSAVSIVLVIVSYSAFIVSL